MRAVEVIRFGGPEVLRVVDAPDPVPGPGEVVVDVSVAGVGWVDTMIRRGHGRPYFAVEPPYRPGGAVGGVVSGVGAGVDPGWAGRRVVARTGASGGYVERALVPADALVAVPDGLDLDQATTLLLDGTTALGLMDIVGVKPGDRVLVTAAGGAMGLLLLQLASAAGALVVGAARGTAKLDRVREAGADLAVDYSQPGWTDAVGPVDVVLDGAGGDYGRAAFELVADGGRFSAHGAPGGGFAVPDAERARARGIGVTGIERLQFSPADSRRYTTRALAEAVAGRITALIGLTLPLDNAAAAHAAIEDRTAVGKVLLTTR
jgi:NADPH2:quinone reductase